MQKYMEETLKYYNENYKLYNSMWSNFEFDIPNIFLSYLEKGTYILDLGCGVGRDSKYFIDNGYKVKAIDGSSMMCKIASENIGVEVEQINFLDIDYKNLFDGIFACASLLHLDNEDLIIVLNKIKDSLKEDGILYTCFKYGVLERFEKRYYNDMTEDKFFDIIKLVDGFKIEKVWITDQYNTDSKFINFILRKEVSYE